jgi:hypothetical protein
MTDDLTASDSSSDDAELFADLRHAIDSFDAVPDHARLAAHDLLSWRRLDDELAELQFDSAVDAAGVRGLAWPRQLSFEAAATSIEIEIDEHHIVGQVVPPAEVDVQLTNASGGTTSIRSDAVGHFRFEHVERGAIRLTASLPDGSVTTQWFSI